nr:deoxyribose-phosphate aldolase [Heliorestis acidaminivorans]
MQDLAVRIDHTLLKAEAQEKEISKLCLEAVQYSFASVCVNPLWVEKSAQLLAGSPVKVATVIAFPLGATLPALKASEAREMLQKGAQELDMVMNLGLAKAGNWDAVQDDISAVVEEARSYSDIIVKVILETALLKPEEIEEACRRAVQAGADYVKTSTGFGPAGATLEDVALMKKTVAGKAKVKASGGIRSAQEALAMIQAGADRLGTSASLKIIEQIKAT